METAIFFTADTHFGHEKVIQYCNRPYKSVEEMNETLIDNWNKVVPKGGLVYHLGDFAWRFGAQYADRLNGQIYLIKGSHDYEQELTPSKKFVKIERLHNHIIDNQRITMCHYCMRVWHLSHYNSWHIFGHSHGRLEPIGKSWDVGVDCNNYTPVSWEELKVIMDKRPDNFNLTERFKKARDEAQVKEN